MQMLYNSDSFVVVAFEVPAPQADPAGQADPGATEPVAAAPRLVAAIRALAAGRHSPSRGAGRGARGAGAGEARAGLGSGRAQSQSPPTTSGVRSRRSRSPPRHQRAGKGGRLRQVSLPRRTGAGQLQHVGQR